MSLHTVVLYGCAAAVVVPGTRLVMDQVEGRRSGPGGLLAALWRRPVPRAAAVLVGVMAAMAVVQTAVPGVMPHLERDPHGPWWRVVTALLVQTSGRGQLALNLAALAVVAPAAERRLGAVWMPVVLVLSGVVAHGVSTAGWSVHGGGDSVGICGLVGALAASCALTGRRRPLRLVSLLVPAAGVVLCVAENNHGAGVVTGAVLGAALALVPEARSGRTVAA
ncbi:rhomboid family intramembrane serine protease [Streptomyces sp. NBC_01185]|uniref:rhomboid family intramembrane serine protease n=1 Tax=Streptomyces sp. NBC_01185 TaxID=2903764 RepID=UPI00386FB417|nr:rhomboid family intramembrane serine protease [Streptomyces sp. NBC_01185]